MSRSVTIEIESKPFTYLCEDGDFSWDTLPEIEESDAIETLKSAKKLFDEIELEFCLAFGTLLGAVREKGIIKGDQDVDIYITDEDKLYRNLPWLFDHGFRVIRIRKGILYSFRVKDDCYIDVYILRPLRFSVWSLYCYSLVGNAIPKKYVKETQEIEVFGDTFKCPKDPEKLLEWWYGKDWRIPQSKKGHYEVRSRKIWKRVKHYIKRAPSYLMEKLFTK